MEPIIIKKSAIERIHVGVSEYKGKQYADMRVFFETDGGEWAPTKKGLTVAPAPLPELIAALIELDRAMTPTPGEAGERHYSKLFGGIQKGGRDE